MKPYTRLKSAYQPLCGLMIVITAILLSGCGGGLEIEALQPTRGAIHESFSEPARTRLSRTYPITMPIDGRIGRIELEPGDPVTAGQELVSFERLPYEQRVAEARAAVRELNAETRLNEYDELEETMLIETEATIDATREAVNASMAQVEAEEARSNRAAKEQKRIRKLSEEKTVARSALDDANLLAETTLIQLRKQQFNLAGLQAIFTAIKLGPRYIDKWLGRKRLKQDVISERLIQARARLARAEHDLGLARIESPIDGVVLEKYEQGDAALPAGQQLLLLGNLQELEIIADVLTLDAMKLTVGARVELETVAGREPLIGEVKRIEPAGFTKLSSLGVEQQRVNVIVAFEVPPEGLGVGYRLQARFFTGSHPDAVVVPRYSVLQSPDQSYYVFKIERGRLVRQAVRLGLRSELELEILQGVTPDDTIAATPDTTMREGEKVKIRSNGV